MIGPSQRPLPYNTQQSQQIDIHAPCGNQTRSPKKLVAAELRLWLRGTLDRLPSYCEAVLSTGTALCRETVVIDNCCQSLLTGWLYSWNFDVSERCVCQMRRIPASRKKTFPLNIQSPLVTLCTTSFDIPKFHEPARRVYVFCTSVRAHSDYFPIRH